MHSLSGQPNYVLVFIGDTLKVFDTKTYSVAEVVQEQSAMVEADKFYAFSTTNELKFRVMVLGKKQGLKFLMNIDFKWDTFIPAIN